MLLAIDIGNSNIVSGLFDKGKWIEDFRIDTAVSKTANEYETIYRAFFTGRKINPADIDKVVLCSVVPLLTQPIREMIQKLTDKEPLIISRDLYPKLKINIVNPYQIGTDLVANAIAAYNKFREPCIVVDFGTALTFTVVNAQGNLLGVSIAPGLRTAMASLSQKTAQLPNIELIAPASYIGKNTVHAMQSGIVLGYKGLVESVIEGIVKELKTPAKVIATGGLSTVIAPLTDCFSCVEPLLTLDGLRIIGEKFYATS